MSDHPETQRIRWRPVKRLERTGVGLGLGLVLSACAIVGPLADSDMSRAPRSACVTFGSTATASADPSAPPPAPGCFVLNEMDADGRRTVWRGGAIQPGRTLLAVKAGTPQCAGFFTHMTLTGSSSEGGSLELATFELFGRPGRHRTVSWNGPVESRTFTLPSISDALMNPTGARVTVASGTFEPQSLCFRSY